MYAAGIFLLLVLSSPLYYGYIIKFYSSTVSWVRNARRHLSGNRYAGFKIPLPEKYEVHGIDVSYYQGKIDWQLVRAMEDDGVKLDFAFIKATEGLLKVDPYFQRNWREATKAGLLCGAYHFFRPLKDGSLQARFFLQVVNPENGDLPMVVDIESLDGVSPSLMRQRLKDFLHHIEKKTHKKPIIYSGLKFYQDYLSEYFSEYPLWIAHYYKEELKMNAHQKWEFWQHSDIGRVNGIDHNVDFNVFRGTRAELQNLLN